MHCQGKYTPNPKHNGYPESLRKRATEMYVDGDNLRRIARDLKVSPQCISLGVTDMAKALPNAPITNEVEEAEMDKIFTFIGDEKKTIYILTFVDRKTRCILG